MKLPAEELQRVAGALESFGADVRVVEAASASFVVATLGTRGAEVYPSGSRWIVDPAGGEQLHGEVEADNPDEAVRLAWQWIERGEGAANGA